MYVNALKQCELSTLYSSNFYPIVDIFIKRVPSELKCVSKSLSNWTNSLFYEFNVGPASGICRHYS